MLNVLYAQCHKGPFKMLSVVMLNVTMLSAVMLSVATPFLAQSNETL
jgi:hypothetical protein